MNPRVTVRLIVRDDKGLLLRRAPFREAVAQAMLCGWSAHFETKS